MARDQAVKGFVLCLLSGLAMVTGAALLLFATAAWLQWGGLIVELAAVPLVRVGFPKLLEAQHGR